MIVVYCDKGAMNDIVDFDMGQGHLEKALCDELCCEYAITMKAAAA